MRFLVFAAIVALAGCDAAHDPGEVVTPKETGSCERNAQSQILCFRTAFELEGCTDLAPIGSMYKDAEATYAHLTAFDASPACQAEAKAAALDRGFTEEGEGEYARDFGEGYRELLTITAEGTLQWEREQQ